MIPYFDYLLDPGKASRRARQTTEASMDRGAQYTEPYREAGNRQVPIMEGEQQKLLDPAGMQNQWADSYEMSPYAQNKMEFDTQQGQDLASSMGLLGSSTALSGLGANSSMLYQQDRQQYLNDLMNKYMAGIGIGQNIYNQGANSANQLSGQWGANAAGMGNAAYNANNAVGQLVDRIGGMGISALSGGMGGGGMQGAVKGLAGNVGSRGISGGS